MLLIYCTSKATRMSAMRGLFIEKIYLSTIINEGTDEKTNHIQVAIAYKSKL